MPKPRKRQRDGTSAGVSLLVAEITGPEDDVGLTAKELVAQSRGQSLKTVQDKLKALIAAGRIVVGSRVDTDATGRRIRVPVYRMKTEDASA